MESLKTRLEGAEKIAVLGIGSKLRGDDAAGMLAAEKLGEYFSRNKSRIPVKVFFGETAPENSTGEIKKFQPSHIIIIDAVDMGRPAGTLAIIDPESEACASFSTHRIPCKILVEYLGQSLGAEVILLGIQPKLMEFGNPVSPAVKSAIDKLIFNLQRYLPII